MYLTSLLTVVTCNWPRQQPASFMLQCYSKSEIMFQIHSGTMYRSVAQRRYCREHFLSLSYYARPLPACTVQGAPRRCCSALQSWLLLRQYSLFSYRKVKIFVLFLKLLPAIIICQSHLLFYLFLFTKSSFVLIIRCNFMHISTDEHSYVHMQWWAL